MSKQVIVILADGFEEVEAVTPIDILRRAGCQVIVAGAGKREITSVNGVKVLADVILEDYKGIPDMVVLPGGAQGAANLRDSEAVKALLLKADKEKKLIAAICASPAVVLLKTGLLDGKTATCYPGYEITFAPNNVTFSEQRVVRDGRITTSRGPGTAMEFAIDLVRQLVDDKTADDILKKTLAKV